MRITVIGDARAELPPELAVLHLTLGHESGDLDKAVREATQLAQAMNAEFLALKDADPCPVTETVLLPLATRSWRPWAQDGSQLPLRHEAQSRAKLTFSNFRAMSAFINGWAREPGVVVDHVEWRLTEQRERAEKSRILADAVADAHERAGILSIAAGQGEVRFVELSDSPLDGGAPPGLFAAAGADSAMMRSGGGVDLTPEDIRLEARVHARFTTD